MTLHQCCNFSPWFFRTSCHFIIFHVTGKGTHDWWALCSTDPCPMCCRWAPSKQSRLSSIGKRTSQSTTLYMVVCTVIAVVQSVTLGRHKSLLPSHARILYCRVTSCCSILSGCAGIWHLHCMSRFEWAMCCSQNIIQYACPYRFNMCCCSRTDCNWHPSCYGPESIIAFLHFTVYSASHIPGCQPLWWTAPVQNELQLAFLL